MRLRGARGRAGGRAVYPVAARSGGHVDGGATVSSQSTRFLPSGVVTLTTDFGLKDPFVGVMKGRVLRRFRRRASST